MCGNRGHRGYVKPHSPKPHRVYKAARPFPVERKVSLSPTPTGHRKETHPDRHFSNAFLEKSRPLVLEGIMDPWCRFPGVVVMVDEGYWRLCRWDAQIELGAVEGYLRV